MNLYSQYIFPRLCDFFLGRKFVSRHRRDLLAHAAGNVLEIGCGTGLNLAHYPPAIRHITAVDPSAGMNRLARRRARNAGIDIDQRAIGSERLPFADSTFDCVVSTFTLCSIDDVDRALHEIHRVLKPGGRFLFLEHGLSCEPGVQKWQRRLNWLEMRLGDGCRLVRNIRDLVAGQPFAAVEHQEFYLEHVPRTHGYMYRGIATK